jgi:hypothetical protein
VLIFPLALPFFAADKGRISRLWRVAGFHLGSHCTLEPCIAHQHHLHNGYPALQNPQFKANIHIFVLVIWEEAIAGMIIGRN